MHSLVLFGLLCGCLVTLSGAAVTTQPPPLIRTLSAGGDIGPQFEVEKPKEPEGKKVPISGASLVKRKKSARVDVITINGMQQHERFQKERHLQWKIPIFFFDLSARR